MTTFQEYQQIAAKVPIALRNDRDRIELPILGLQEEAGKLGKIFSAAFVSGKFSLTPAQSSQVKERLADTLWCIARLCSETGISMEEAAKHGVAQIRERAQELDPDRR
jgi:hypothetical protein